MLLLSAAAVAAAASADLQARSLGAQQFATNVQMKWNPEFGRATGRVDSAISSCERNRVIRITATREGADPVLETARTDRRGNFSAEVDVGEIADAGATAIAAVAPEKTVKVKGKKKKCRPGRSRPTGVFRNRGCRSEMRQHPRIPNEKTIGVQCPVEVSRIQERATAPITNFENPGVALPPPGGEGFRQIPGTQLSPRVVQYDPSPGLPPNWLFLNGIQGPPQGSQVRVLIWLLDAIQMIPLRVP